MYGAPPALVGRGLLGGVSATICRCPRDDVDDDGAGDSEGTAADT
eukprot:COSAG06_NODE_37652_length_432_cov_2.459459_1_plen_44_part_10